MSKPDDPVKRRATEMVRAIESQDLRTAARLIEEGLDVKNMQHERSDSALHLTVLNEQPRMMKFL
jgi:hypothetical protein